MNLAGNLCKWLLIPVNSLYGAIGAVVVFTFFLIDADSSPSPFLRLRYTRSTWVDINFATYSWVGLERECTRCSRISNHVALAMWTVIMLLLFTRIGFDAYRLAKPTAPIHPIILNCVKSVLPLVLMLLVIAVCVFSKAVHDAAPLVMQMYTVSIVSLLVLSSVVWLALHSIASMMSGTLTAAPSSVTDTGRAPDLEAASL